MSDVHPSFGLPPVFAPSNITVAILAGGLGTRLRPAVSDRPKVMAEVAGRPFLVHWLDRLQDLGFRRVVLCTGHQAEIVRSSLGAAHGSLDLTHSVEPLAMGTAGAIRHALPHFPAGPVLVINGDSYCELDLITFTDWHIRRHHLASLALTQVTDTRRYGRVETRENGRVIHFAEKQETYGRGWINAGIYLFDRELIAEIPVGDSVSLEREMLPRWLEQGRLFGFRAISRFLDIGTPESYRQAESFFASLAAEVVA